MSMLRMLPIGKETSRKKKNKQVSGDRDIERVGTTVPFQMDLHVPCRVAGKTRDGSRWEGEAKTLSVSSHGAHIMLPAAILLEGTVKLVFKVPSALRTLFVRKRFGIEAEVKPSDGTGVGAMGRKVIHVVFKSPIFFKVKNTI